MIAACSQWPEVVAWVGIVWAFAACYIAWRFTGGKHYGDRHGPK